MSTSQPPRSRQVAYIGVVGADPSNAPSLAAAEEVGALIAQNNAVLVCGGLGGVMETACRGAKSQGGTTVGILPADNRLNANPYVDIAIPTGMGEARNALVVRASDVLIAIGGEFGTLSEIALALKMGKPVVGMATWELAKQGEKVNAVIETTGAAEAVRLALNSARRIK